MKIRTVTTLLIALLLLFSLAACSADTDDVEPAVAQPAATTPPPSEPGAEPGDSGDTEDAEEASSLTKFTRNTENINYGDITFNKWDIEAAGANLNDLSEKAYTIMIYMNGCDLESGGGAATGDIQEMLESGVSRSNVNVLLFTGGTAEWQNGVIPSDACMIWLVDEGKLIPIADVGNITIGDPGTLAAFIDFGMTYFPAQKYAVSFWNHGGGLTGGFGNDENFPENNNLSLLEINMAFENSMAAETQLEWISYDACLMATIETAILAEPYAKYLIASEDLEPGQGWDYQWLTTLNENPTMSGAEIGEVICDTFVDFYDGSGLDTTQSVIDLAEIGYVVSALDALMTTANDELETGAFNKIAKARDNTRTFGGGSPRDNYCDMVDLGHMAERLANQYPDEAAALSSALENAVVYNRAADHMENINGLTAYYIYGGKDAADEYIGIYEALNLGEGYTDFLRSFASVLTGESLVEMPARSNLLQQDEVSGDYSVTLSAEELENLSKIEYTLWEPVPGEEELFYLIGQHSNVEIDASGKILTEFDGYWPGMAGEFVCMYELEKEGGRTTYAIPAELNGQDVDIIAIFDEKNPNGKILGARILYEDSDLASKGLLEIKPGDKVSFVYQAEYFGEDETREAVEWHVGEEITVDENFKLDWFEVNSADVYVYGYLLTDMQLNEYYTDFIEVTFE